MLASAIKQHEVDGSNIETLTNRRLSHYNCLNNRALLPIYESVFTSPFASMVVYDLYNIFKDNGWQVKKVTALTQKSCMFGKCPDNNITFWLAVELQNNSPDTVSSWLICPDKTPLIITLFIAKVENSEIKQFIALIKWDPTDTVLITDTVKLHIQQLITQVTN